MPKLKTLSPKQELYCVERAKGASFAQVGQRLDLTTPLDALREVYGDVVYEQGVAPAHRVPPLRYIEIATADDPSVRGMNVDYFIEDEADPAVREVRVADHTHGQDEPGQRRRDGAEVHVGEHDGLDVVVDQ